MVGSLYVYASRCCNLSLQVSAKKKGSIVALSVLEVPSPQLPVLIKFKSFYAALWVMNCLQSTDIYYKRLFYII